MQSSRWLLSHGPCCRKHSHQTPLLFGGAAVGRTALRNTDDLHASRNTHTSSTARFFSGDRRTTEHHGTTAEGPALAGGSGEGAELAKRRQLAAKKTLLGQGTSAARCTLASFCGGGGAGICRSCNIGFFNPNTPPPHFI